MLSTLPEILFETNELVALNKPAGLLSIPDRKGDEVSLKSLLRDRYGEIYTVHRLDRNTSGVIVFAKTEAAHQFLSIAFEERNVEKYYSGIVQGRLGSKEGAITEALAMNQAKQVMTINKKGKPSRTDYEVVEDFGKFSLVNFRIHTGRTHQIRVHMQFAGHPVVCDDLYGDPAPIYISALKKNYKLSKSELDERPILSRLGLHAARLVFTYSDGAKIDLTAEMPKDMRALLQQLRKWKKHGAL